MIVMMILICGSFAGNFDPKTLDKRHMMRAQMAIFHLIMRDENTNVNGLVYLLDMTGLEVKHQLFWTLEDIKRNMHLFQVKLICLQMG